MQALDHCKWTEGDYAIHTSPNVLDFEVVYTFLSAAPWASGLSRKSMAQALRNSLCFSLLERKSQIGLARVITDRVTYAYLCDVYIVPSKRGLGLGTWLMHCVLSHPEIRDLKRIALLTHDAQDFYLRLGFHFGPADHYMERIQELARSL